MTPHERRQRAKEFLRRTNLIYMPGYEPQESSEAGETADTSAADAEAAQRLANALAAYEQNKAQMQGGGLTICAPAESSAVCNADKLILIVIIMQALMLLAILMRK